MANNMQKEEWIDAVMNSTEGMARANPQMDLFEKITFKLNNQAVRIISIPMKQWAAAAILLLALNIGSVVYFAKQNKKTGVANTDSGLAAEMQLESTYNY